MTWAITDAPPTNWWDIPAVQRRQNRLISGDDRVDFAQYVCRRYLAGRENLRALSLGCGTGKREQRWAETGKFEGIDAYDLSAERIAFARRNAEENGSARVVDFRVGDIYKVELEREGYDAVLAEGALHHFSPLRTLLRRIESCLRKDGLLIVNDFVGPTRFQWTKRQLEAINGLLVALPEKYRRLWQSDEVKRRVFRPSRLMMRVGDPSEAVESARIVPLLHEVFDVLELKQYGGTILLMLFHAIAHHFRGDDEETRRALDLCFAAEDTLMASGDIGSDFVVAVCRRRE